MDATRVCQVVDCGQPFRARGMCGKHYQRAKARGLANKTIPPILDRFWSRVEKAPTCWLWIGYKQPKGYGEFIPHRGHKVLAHRYSYELEYGPIAPGMQVDHICRQRSCVRPEHLRLVTNKRNQEHRPPVSRTGRSGLRGVSWHGQSRKWRAIVKHNGKAYSAGLFSSKDDAGNAVRELRNRLYTHNDLDRVNDRDS